LYLKKAIRELIKRVVASNLCWSIGSPLFQNIPYLLFLRKQVVIENHKLLVSQYFEDLIVKNGIFKGLKYPKLEASGSAIYPKLLGSYESELNGVLDEILTKPFTVFIDIGCAEGYYLAGIANKIDKIKLIGIDISESALNQTQKMLQKNGVDLINVSLLQKFDTTLIPKNNTDQVLLICDCEGYEEIIFNANSCVNFSNCTLLIECHDYIVPNITETLVNTLKLTHHLEIIRSTLDETFKFDFIPSELQKLSLEEKLQLVQEGRPTQMNWIYAKPHTI